MGFSMKFDTVNSGWSIVYIEGSLVITSKRYCNSNFVDGVCLSNIAYSDEMPHLAAFHLGLHCLPKYLFMGIHTTKC